MPRFLAYILCLVLLTFWAETPSAQSSVEGGPRIASVPGGGEGARARVAREDLPVYYVVDARPELRAGPGTGASLGRLDFRRGVRVRGEHGPWRLVEDMDSGAQLGWVDGAALSNLWILMDKPSRTLYVYRGTELVRELAADVSNNPEGDKVRRAGLTEREHHRIPEGTYFVTRKNPNSQYYRSFMLSYPNADDADRGLAAGLITAAQHRAIVSANERFTNPPQGTVLGGAIAIHGQGSGRRRAWTRGCVALRDLHMDQLWDIVHVGTPVFIR